MVFPFEEQPQQFFQSRGFRDVNQFARGWKQIRARLRLAPQRVKVLDVNDAAHLVQVAALAKRESRVACSLGDFEALNDVGLGVEHGDFLPRTHHVARGAAAQFERVEHNLAAKSARARLLLRRDQQQAQLFL